jgi:formamidopyrimidine-DNA glycosylase
MPELPEVETTLRGVGPYVIDQTVEKVIVRQAKLRVPVSSGLGSRLRGQIIRGVERRAKYLLFRFDCGTLSIHLGMSGRLQVLPVDTPAKKHDHVDLVLRNGTCLRLRDPRRFGHVVWLGKRPQYSKWLAHLGPEPFNADFNGDYLYRCGRGRKVTIKQFIMDGRIVVGIGNIYASEALYLSRIHPKRQAGRISRKRYHRLCLAIQCVLKDAIEAGGTTLQDFRSVDGRSGYFQQKLAVYGRDGHPCYNCRTLVRRVLVGQRSGFYCPRCQR